MTSETTITPPTTARRSLLLPGLLLAVVMLLAGSATAIAAPPNPVANIAAGTLPSACTSTANGRVCINGVLATLDSARARLGFGPYLVPSDFASLPGTEQLLILCNLDRLAYGLPPIDGLSPALNAVAAAGVTADADPDPSALLSGLSDFGWASNWAGAFPNAPEAYYAWMYYDGWGGKQTSNLDCTSPTASGCWGHRQDVLSFPQQGMLAMGAAVTQDAQGQLGYAMTLVWTPASSTNWTSYSYGWATAKADGAGSPNQKTSSVRRRPAHGRRHAHARIG